MTFTVADGLDDAGIVLKVLALCDPELAPFLIPASGGLVAIASVEPELQADAVGLKNAIVAYLRPSGTSQGTPAAVLAPEHRDAAAALFKRQQSSYDHMAGRSAVSLPAGSG